MTYQEREMDRDYQATAYQTPAYQERGYQDRDGEDRGYQDRGHQDARYQNSGYQDLRYQNTPYDDGRYYRPRAKAESSMHDVVIGLLGGVAGVIAMDIFSQQVMPMLTQSDEKEKGGGKQSGQQSSKQEQPLDSIAVIGQHHRSNESSTAALGRILYHWATDEDPDKQTKSTLSYLVHWGYGIGQGGVYASMRGPVDGFDLPGGLAFGTALWLLGDEMAVPMLGLQEGPTASGVTTHVNRLAMHLVYGVTTAATTQWLRRLV
ncbi:MAG: hypothetical protein R3C14_26390 [Caldilineaceae bacterium]